MINVINNHMYNTDTDELLGSRNNGKPAHGGLYYEENLYRNRGGYYYIHSIAGVTVDPFAYGSSTDFSGGAHSYGARIRPITNEEAEAWMAK